jgi:hypothetical protein
MCNQKYGIALRIAFDTKRFMKMKILKIRKTGYKKLLIFFLLSMIICFGACTNQTEEPSKAYSEEAELYTVSDTISIRTGTSFDGQIVLEAPDFNGFNYKYNELIQDYIFTFWLTEEGQKKMTGATIKLAENSGDLSLWIGDDLIVSPRVEEPITGDGFCVNIDNLSEDSIFDFVDRLEGD